MQDYFEYNDDYPTCQRTHASLCIYLPDMEDPDLISKKLGIKPSRTQIRGEFYRGKMKEWPTAWFLESDSYVQSKELRRHIDWLLDQLQGKSEIFQQFMRSGVDIVLSCFWTSAWGHGGPMLDPKILKRLAELDLGIGFDIYFEGDDDIH